MSESGAVRPYALKAGEGWTYNFDVEFTIKARELGNGPRVAVAEFAAGKGEEGPDHKHDTEDEMFYVLDGELTVRCGGERFDVGTGAFVFLPRGLEHGFQVRSDKGIRLLIISAPVRGQAEGNGWGGFLGDVEREGKILAEPR